MQAWKCLVGKNVYFIPIKMLAGLSDYFNFLAIEQHNFLPQIFQSIDQSIDLSFFH